VAGAVQLGAKEDPAPAEIALGAPTTTESPEPTVSEPDTTSTIPEPFVYRIGVLSGVSTDNFWAYYGSEPSVWNSYILGPTKPALYTIDDAAGELTTELAASEAQPTWNSSGWRLRVALDPRYRWSDGQAITAHDFVFTFETVRRLGLGGSWAEAFPAPVESVHADGDYELRIEFSERPNLRVWPYGVGLAPVMPEHIWAEDADTEELLALSGSDDVSGGPVAVDSISDDLIVSHANPGYPETTVPDTVEYHVYPDEAALVSAISDGGVDAILTPKGVTEEQAATVVDQPGVSVLASPANGIRYLGFNLERAPMSEPAFRTALALLLDREALSEQIPQTGEVAWSMIPAANDHWFDTESVEANRSRYSGELADRLARALEALGAAGYAWETPPAIGEDASLSAGEGLTIGGRPPQPLTILTPGDAYDPARPDYVSRIADTLGILGFDARPVETDFDTVVDLAFTPGEDGAWEYDMYLLGWTLGNPTLPSFYRPFFAPDGEVNNTGYGSQQFAAALQTYEQAYTVEEAKRALWEMEETLSVDLPYLVLYTNRLTELYRSDRVAFAGGEILGGLQARLGGIGDVTPVD
jgi:peptide/nickel transport system substrate-binding protein